MTYFKLLLLLFFYNIIIISIISSTTFLFINLFVVLSIGYCFLSVLASSSLAPMGAARSHLVLLMIFSLVQVLLPYTAANALTKHNIERKRYMQRKEHGGKLLIM